MANVQMKKHYYTPSRPSAYSTLERLEKAVGKKKNVKEWLLQQDTYTLHKPARKRFPRNPYTVDNIDSVWEADLVDLKSLAKYNDKYKYLLNVIDVFSKKAYSVPLISKTGIAVRDAFQKMVETDGRKPDTLQTDKGLEFQNNTFQSYLRKLNIDYHTTQNPDIKAAVVERFNRTLKTKMFKYFTYKNTFRYVDVLDDFISAYNNTFHTTIGMTPNEVNPRRVLEILENMKRKFNKIRKGKVKFHVGDTVRISKEKMKFAKGYEQNFSTEIFKVAKVIPRTPQPVYELEDLNGRPIIGKFYNFELVRVIMTEETEFKIDKILAERNRRGIVEYLVRWKGYDSSFDSWIKESDIRPI